ncbi:MAG: hypothetical protein CFE26_07855 [Verrucomicrobiales bacterium VVV1]|nr:MAG: hypothetical protein CFE26_07855 [Verrucomicrobiales bacterium VVV1]
MGFLIYGIGALGSLACFVLVLIKMFKTEKPLMGILGILSCGIWAYIWGWMNSTKHGLKQIMLGWTVAIVLCVVGSLMSGAKMVKAIEEQQKALPSSAPAR